MGRRLINVWREYGLRPHMINRALIRDPDRAAQAIGDILVASRDVPGGYPEALHAFIAAWAAVYARRADPRFQQAFQTLLMIYLTYFTQLTFDGNAMGFS